MIKERYKKVYYNIAQEISSLSYANRLKVGAIIVKENRIISIGFNGTPPGWNNECEEESGEVIVTKPEVQELTDTACLTLKYFSQLLSNF